MTGNAWGYEYAPRGGLARAIGPNGRDILRVRYDRAGRVKESLTGRQYVFTYAQDQTLVVEGAGHSHVFGQNAAGITVRFDSTNGVWWRLSLDERNRVSQAHSDNGAHQYAYGRNGQVSRVYEQLPEGLTTSEFERDDEGRITRVSSSDGGIAAVDYAGGLTVISGRDGELSFNTLPSGRIGEASRDQTSIRADYDSEGHLFGLRKGARAVAMMAFEKPSNLVFQPLEYRSTNCCINIVILPAALVPGGGKRPLSDGIRIKLYNGAQAHWIVWENKDWAEWKAKGRQEGKPEPLAYWEYNEGAGYVGRVANAAPCP